MKNTLKSFRKENAGKKKGENPLISLLFFVLLDWPTAVNLLILKKATDIEFRNDFFNLKVVSLLLHISVSHYRSLL